jgi:MFS superfamily sulfate permease-like transporter
VIFTTTIVAVLATDLLVGIGIGIAVKAFIHLVNGLPLSSMLKPYLEVQPQGEDTVVISARGSAVFTNWLPFKREIEQIGLAERNNVVVDLSGTKLVDHSVMEKLHEMEMDFDQAGLRFEVVGLDGHRQLSDHPHAARKKGGGTMRRLTLLADVDSEAALVDQARALDAVSCTSIECRDLLNDGRSAPSCYMRVEVLLTPTACDRFLAWVRREPGLGLEVACVERVDVARQTTFGNRSDHTLDADSDAHHSELQNVL